MRVRMLVDRTGTDNGRSYPPAGAELDVPDALGADLCKAGWAAPVAVKDADVETREAKAAPAVAAAPAAPPKATAKKA